MFLSGNFFSTFLCLLCCASIDDFQRNSHCCGICHCHVKIGFKKILFFIFELCITFRRECSGIPNISVNFAPTILHVSTILVIVVYFFYFSTFYERWLQLGRCTRRRRKVCITSVLPLCYHDSDDVSLISPFRCFDTPTYKKL